VNGENGWIVPASDVDELARALREALSTPIEVLERMGTKGRQRVLAEHDVNIEARKLAELFRGSPAKT
jgi:glycosyltransferase involved in cell wall biosynthesis